MTNQRIIQKPYSYLLKKEIIYNVLKCPKETIIPTNDIELWKNFPQYHWVYNKINICKEQNIPCGPMGISPQNDDYPVILKPIINLLGMGMGISIASNADEYDKLIKPGFFWMPFVKGHHLSCDFILVEGNIKWYCCFEGYPASKGMFDYWETLPEWQPEEELIKWIQNKFNSYTGCLNIEIIGKTIIECHMRMGDINHLHSIELMQNIINIYQGKEWKLQNYQIPKIYLVPIFIGNYFPIRLSGTEIFKICHNIDPKGEFIYTYQIDPIKIKNNPPGGKRIANLNVNCLEIGFKVRKEVLNQINKIKYRYFMMLLALFIILFKIIV